MQKYLSLLGILPGAGTQIKNNQELEPKLSLKLKTRARAMARTTKSVEIGKELPGKSYMLMGNYSAARQVKSNNMPRIAGKP